MAEPQPPPRKSVLITGCTPGGIGFGLAKEFQARGYHVLATARHPDVLDALAHEGLTPVPLDVTSAASIAACRQRVDALLEAPRLDILVNNAGRGLVVPATDVDLADARAVYETNVFGAMAMVAAFADLVVAARGLVVNVASASAVAPYVFGAVYASSKAALAAYSRVLRAELRPLGVGVVVVMAGAVRSNMGAPATVKGALPEDSLFARVRHLYDARRGFSQKTTSGPMETAEFARRLVDGLERPEVPSFWRAWFGRPDWFWCGGMARLLYWGSILGEWVLDLGAWRKFGLRELEVMVERERKAKLE